MAALGAVLGSCSWGNPEASIELRDRGEFVRAISKIRSGMTKADVISILGPPDDVRTPSDPPGISIPDCSEIYCYGSTGHLSCATLGRVSFTGKGIVQQIWGNSGQPPPRSMFVESRLREVISILYDCAKRSSFRSNGGQSFDPGGVVQAVNSLLALGKEKALAAIQEADRVRVAGGLETFLVLRLMFTIPADPGYMPSVPFGAPEPPEPKDPKRFPLYPLVLIDDIPLLPLMGYSAIGFPESIDRHLEYFTRNGNLRPSPLVPTERPLEILRKIEEPPYSVFTGLTPSQENEVRSVLRCQLLRLLKPVVRTHVDLEAEGRLIFDGDLDWVEEEREASRLKIRWNLLTNNYTFLDGTTLKQEVLRYRRIPWKAIVADTEILVIVERKSRSALSVTAVWPLGKLSDLDKFQLKVYREKDRENPLKTIALSNARLPSQPAGHSEMVYQRGAERICSSTVAVSVGEDEAIRLEISSKGEMVIQTTVQSQ